jgi:hypothetical protein
MARHDFSERAIWKGDKLLLGRKKIAEIFRDRRWPVMWRFHLPSGGVSDMFNRTRAKDGAMATIERILRRGERRPVEAPIRENHATALR